MFIDITLLGEVEQGKAVRRSGAKPGDAILVTGYPGQAAAGITLFLPDGERCPVKSLSWDHFRSAKDSAE